MDKCVGGEKKRKKNGLLDRTHVHTQETKSFSVVREREREREKESEIEKESFPSCPLTFSFDRRVLPGLKS